MSAGQAINVAELARTLLDAVVAHYAADVHANRRDLPERVYVAPGDTASVAWDCEQFTVALIGVGTGPAPEFSPSASKPGTNVGALGTRHAILSATLVRCTPTVNDDGDFPTVAELDDAGMTYLRDVGLVSQALVEAASRLRAVDRSAVVTAGAVQPIGPSGGFVGLEGQFVVTSARLV